MHLDENRKATVVVEVQAKVKSFADYSALGYHLGKTLGNDVPPYFKNLKPEKTEFLKELGAAMAATGSIALYHVEGETPEYRDAIADKLETITVEDSDLKAVRESFQDDWSEIGMILVAVPTLPYQRSKK